MTKEEIRKIINEENGEGFANNINLNGYTFTKNGSFIVFEFKMLEDIKVCHIKYIYFKNEKDLTTILVNCCNFWMGNSVQFIFYKEKRKKVSAIQYLRDLNFRVDILNDYRWKWKFKCLQCGDAGVCMCPVYSMYK